MTRSLIAISLSLILLFGCTGKESSGTPVKSQSKELAEQSMNLAGVQNARIISEGGTVAVEYDPADAAYEDQIISEWGAIFGVLSSTYPGASQYQIVQLYNGEKIATITAKASDVKAFMADQITADEFAKRIATKAAK